MATAPQNLDLPLFFNDLLPLSSVNHATWRTRSLDKAPFLTTAHAIPLTSEEFIVASRNFPIVFSQGENPVPLALMAMNEGINVFVDDEGSLRGPMYVPAYVRRYPFMLARLRPDTDELSLCFDPTSNAVGDFAEGDALFDGDQPSAATQAILEFAQQFEEAGMRTQQFVAELKKLDLLMDGEVAIQQQDVEQPYVYRGFLMVDEEKLRELRGDALRKMAQNGMLPLIYAHLFSLSLMRDVFAAQVAQGKGPVALPPMPANA